MKILIKYASRGRCEMFFKRIDAITNTIGNVEYRILCSFDSDDKEMLSSIDRLNQCKNLEYYFNERVSKVDAINRDIDKTDFFWDVLINYSDDMVFVVNKWGEKIIEKIKSVWIDADFFAHFNDGYLGDRLSTMSIIGRYYYHRTHYIYNPSYKSFSCDAEEYYRAMMLGKYHYFEEVYFKHEHPTYGSIDNDATYLLNSKHEDEDTKTYFERMQINFGVKNAPLKYRIMFKHFLKKYYGQ